MCSYVRARGKPTFPDNLTPRCLALSLRTCHIIIGDISLRAAGTSLNAKTWLVLGACLAALAVTLGAFGAHGLPWYYRTLDVAASEAARRSENWEIAARYHMYHALAIIAVGVLADRRRMWLLDAAGLSFFCGILIFSGCLYALALTGTKILGAIVPIGGVSFLVGWMLLALAGKRFHNTDTSPHSDRGQQPSGPAAESDRSNAADEDDHPAAN